MSTATFNAASAAQASQVTSSNGNVFAAIVRALTAPVNTGKTVVVRDATWADGACFM